jgi:hypothetical protein
MGRNVKVNDRPYYEPQRYREKSSQFQASTALPSDKERRNVDEITRRVRKVRIHHV